MRIRCADEAAKLRRNSQRTIPGSEVAMEVLPALLVGSLAYHFFVRPAVRALLHTFVVGQILQNVSAQVAATPGFFQKLLYFVIRLTANGAVVILVGLLLFGATILLFLVSGPPNDKLAAAVAGFGSNVAANMVHQGTGALI